MKQPSAVVVRLHMLHEAAYFQQLCHRHLTNFSEALYHQKIKFSKMFNYAKEFLKSLHLFPSNHLLSWNTEVKVINLDTVSYPYLYKNVQLLSE